MGKNGRVGPMDTRKNEHHQGKSAIGANGHFGVNGRFGTDGHWGKWALGEIEHQVKRAPEQMGIGQLGQISTLGKWVLGKMGTRKNELQGKWVFAANGHFVANGYLRQMSIEGMWRLGEMNVGEMGTLGPMSIGASGHWEKMGTWGKWAPGSTRANGHLGHMG